VGKTKSILIIGGSGFIGTHLAMTLREDYKVFATYHTRPVAMRGVTYIPFNVENRTWIKRISQMARPDVVIYSVGANPKGKVTDRNFRNYELLHAAGPATVLGATDLVQPRFIYLSNAYVFDGTRGDYHETDTVLPGTYLGKLKISGENVVKSKSLNYIILRSSPLIGRGNGIHLSFLDRLRMSLDRNKRFEANQNEIHSFGLVQGFCDTVQRLIESGVRNRILHYGGLTKLSTYDLTREFAKRFKYDPNLIVSPGTASSEGLETNLDYSLNSTQSTETLKIKPLLLEESFDLIDQQLIP
jgi:dTDP-4-dehydrorhamnose reductase